MTLKHILREHTQARCLRRDPPGRDGIGGAQPVLELVDVGREAADRARVHHPTAGDERDLAAQRGQIVHPVAREDDRGAGRGQPGQHAVHVTGAGRIKAVGRFVEHEQSRPGQQRGGKPETLSHPEREAPHAVVRDIGEPDLLQRVADTVGGNTAETFIAKVKPRGVFASVLGAPGNAKDYPSVTVVPVYAQPDAKALVYMAQAVKERKLVIPIRMKLPLRDAAKGHAAAEQGSGKVLLVT